MAESVLQISGLTKNFGGLRVSAGIDLDIRAGEVHALIGPNGAGKTTLVAQISGALRPDAGTIRFQGRDVTTLGVAARARLGLKRVFQISSIIPGFSALENVALATLAARSGLARLIRRPLADPALNAGAHAVLAEVGLAGRAGVVAGTLSHGERRALELAMCLVQKPALLLLDEPMAGTGREEGERLTRLLASLKGRIPMLLVEHDMATVFALADRVTVLVGGAVAMTGTPEAVRSDPTVRAAYLGDEAHA